MYFMKNTCEKEFIKAPLQNENEQALLFSYFSVSFENL